MEFVKKMTGREYVGFSNATYVFRFGVLHLFSTQFHCYWLTFDFRLDRFQSEKETGDRNYAIGYYLKEKKVCASANIVLYKQTSRMLLIVHKYNCDVLLYSVFRMGRIWLMRWTFISRLVRWFFTCFNQLNYSNVKSSLTVPTEFPLLSLTVVLNRGHVWVRQCDGRHTG